MLTALLGSPTPGAFELEEGQLLASTQMRFTESCLNLNVTTSHWFSHLSSLLSLAHYLMLHTRDPLKGPSLARFRGCLQLQSGICIHYRAAYETDSAE